MLPTAVRWHKSKSLTGEDACLLELPCTWLWRDKEHRVVTRIGNYDMHHRAYLSAPQRFVAIRPYACGATGKFWRYKIGAMQHLVGELPGERTVCQADVALPSRSSATTPGPSR